MLQNIRRSVIGDVILRMMGLVVLAVVATAVVDYAPGVGGYRGSLIRSVSVVACG